MIIHDHALYHGWLMLFHATGSALFHPHTMIPALLSGGLAALIANFDPIQTWVDERMTDGSVVLSGIQFLVSLIVVNRVREASIRFLAVQEAYGRFNYALQRLALFFTCAMNDSENMTKKPEEMNRLRVRILRWIRAVHILAHEEFQGVEIPKHRMGTLVFTEEILLHNESRKASRVIRWLSRAYADHRSLIAPGIATDIKMQMLIDEVSNMYGQLLVLGNGIYPMPVAQTSYLSVVVYAVWSPLAFGVLLPHSWFLAPLICFTSVWIAFASNLAAQLLEWPFDGKENDLPLKYLEVRFVKEMLEIEFAADAPLVNVRFEKLLGDYDFSQCDYVVPRDRHNLLNETSNTQECLQRAARDMEEGLQSRRKLKHRLRSAGGQQRQSYDTGVSLSEIRASGRYSVLL